MPPGAGIPETLHEIDIYVFDQLIKGRFDSARRVLDAGCGEGRNLWHLLATGHECFGLDRVPAAVDELRAIAARLAPALPASNFVTGEIDAMPWPDESFDAVICSAVLHFARDEEHFHRMVTEMWRVLKHGGMFFARLASSIGIEELVVPVKGRRARVPDGSERFLVDEAMLVAATGRLGGALLDPIKTTVVQHQRAMTTWVVRKA